MSLVYFRGLEDGGFGHDGSRNSRRNEALHGKLILVNAEQVEITRLGQKKNSRRSFLILLKGRAKNWVLRRLDTQIARMQKDMRTILVSLCHVLTLTEGYLRGLSSTAVDLYRKITFYHDKTIAIEKSTYLSAIFTYTVILP